VGYFTEWFELAQRFKLVKASTIMDGDLKVLTNEGWEVWEYMLKVLPLEKLKQCVEIGHY
jgi:hypothetical protein